MSKPPVKRPVIRHRQRPGTLPSQSGATQPDPLNATEQIAPPADDPVPVYKVGRGKPPLNRRFGQAGGNRPGRKADSKSFISEIDAEMKSRVEILVNGRMKSLRKGKLVARSLVSYRTRMTVAPELTIRLRRAAFNQALAAANIDPIGSVLAPNAVVVTGTDSAILSGRKAQLIAWKREFAAAVRCIYARTTDTVVVSDIEPIALEHGNWTGVSSSDGSTIASGRYTAKWRLVAGEWMIEAEIYLTLA